MNQLPILNNSMCDKTSCKSESCESDDTRSRRRFLNKVSTITFGAMTLTLFPAMSSNEKDEGMESEESDKGDNSSGGGKDQSTRLESPPRYGYLVNTDKCVGTGKCLTACRVENDVPEGCHRTWVERYVHFKDGAVQVDLVPETGYAGSGLPVIDPETVEKAYFVPKNCNHCEDAPCNQVCPVHASFTSPEGFELIDYERCIGCAYCVQACPYGVRFINHETGAADKCTWCYHRVMRDQQPACVEACPVGARLFGRVDDPNSEISKEIAKFPTHVLKEHLGTHPKCSYIGISGEVT